MSSPSSFLFPFLILKRQICSATHYFLPISLSLFQSLSFMHFSVVLRLGMHILLLSISVLVPLFQSIELLFTVTVVGIVIALPKTIT